MLGGALCWRSAGRRVPGSETATRNGCKERLGSDCARLEWHTRICTTKIYPSPCVLVRYIEVVAPRRNLHPPLREAKTHSASWKTSCARKRFGSVCKEQAQGITVVDDVDGTGHVRQVDRGGRERSTVRIVRSCMTSRARNTRAHRGHARSLARSSLGGARPRLCRFHSSANTSLISPTATSGVRNHAIGHEKSLAGKTCSLIVFTSCRKPPPMRGKNNFEPTLKASATTFRNMSTMNTYSKKALGRDGTVDDAQLDVVLMVPTCSPNDHDGRHAKRIQSNAEYFRRTRGCTLSSSGRAEST